MKSFLIYSFGFFCGSLCVLLVGMFTTIDNESKQRDKDYREIL